MRCVILQPSYIPWRGYFDLVRRADVFVFYDDVQYDKHGYRNRNRVKTSQGPRWITIPVLAKGNVEEGTLLKDIRMAEGQPWRKKHLATLEQSYRKAPFFGEYWPKLEGLWRSESPLLCDFTIAATLELSALLGIDKTRFVRSSELGIAGTKTERLIAILKRVGADAYLSGPSAKDYLDEAMFEDARIDLEYIVYDYPDYDQLYPPYDPRVTILDLLFMKGPEAGELIWGSGAGR